ncbi:hypothetical protein B0H12DRAFT_1122911, partial [Mycena haematopus]
MTARAKPRAKPRRGRRRPMQLPPEICAKICEDVGRKDLVTLCRTCRLFGDQAQRLIYRTVDLSHRTPHALRSWCSAVTRHSQLAERAHALSLGLPSDLPFSSDAANIARALSKCVNLKELSIHPEDSGPFGARYESQMSSIQGWIITNCPFRLTKFSNSYFKISFMAQFWTPQSDIRILGIPTCTKNFPIYDDQLPNLIALEIGDVRALPVDRPLQRTIAVGKVLCDVDDVESPSNYGHATNFDQADLGQGRPMPSWLTPSRDNRNERVCVETLELQFPIQIIDTHRRSLIASPKIVQSASWRHLPRYRPSSSTARPSQDSTIQSSFTPTNSTICRVCGYSDWR